MAKVDAVIIAGGTISNPDFREAAGVDCKSLISIHGKPMVYWVAKALRDAETVGSIAVVGPECLADTEVADVADHVLTEENHEVENLLKGVAAISDPKRILMFSGDTPLLTPTAVNDLVESAPEADVVFPTVAKEAIMRDFPGRKWIFVKTKDGEYTGSSAVMFRPHVFEEHRETVIKVFNARRSVADLVMMWGAGFALKFAMGRLSIQDVEDHISGVLGISGRNFVSDYSELAFDVDKASDIDLANERLQSK